MTDSPWWKHAVCYEVYVRSFADSDGDGVGDLPGVTSRLPYLADLGVDAVWLTPFYTSPQNDHGYDVADYRGVDPMFGTITDFRELLRTAHRHRIRVIVDLVPNHTSSDHPWFRAALDAPPGSPERARYVFREGRGDGPPNNWESVFGGPAWSRAPDGQWYLHLFDPSQPDLDWRNPEVSAMFADVLRYWLDLGVDGFRIDVAHGLVKEDGLPDQRITDAEREANVADSGTMILQRPEHEPMWDQPEVHEVYRTWRTILDAYDGDRMAVGEAWTRDAAALARYVRPDELHQSFNFHWLKAAWSAREFADVITETFAAVKPVGASATWVLSNHDVKRHPTRYGGGSRGLARARAATLTMLALPGSAYLYQGEELGLPEVDLPPEHWQDPLSKRTGERGRDGCRVPLPWSGDRPPYGFSEGAPWIPQPDDWAGITVEAQEKDPDSTLSFYRRALEVRRTFAEDAGDDVVLDPLHGDVLSFRRGPMRCVLNCGESPVPLPGGELVLASGPLDHGGAVEGELPPDTAVWLAEPY